MTCHRHVRELPQDYLFGITGLLANCALWEGHDVDGDREEEQRLGGSHF